ncbi:MAG: toxin C-terminal domain-containing protein [Candidatus Fimenecus sp.]
MNVFHKNIKQICGGIIRGRFKTIKELFSDRNVGLRLALAVNLQVTMLIVSRIIFLMDNEYFYNSKTKRYLTLDIDSHDGCVWKMAKTVEDLRSKSTRLGTFDEFLNWMGK